MENIKKLQNINLRVIPFINYYAKVAAEGFKGTFID